MKMAIGAKSMILFDFIVNSRFNTFSTYEKRPSSHVVLLLSLGFISTSVLHGQPWIPAAGSTVTYNVSSGQRFYDPGGNGGCPGTSGCVNNYPNCNCMTTTTLCPSTAGEKVQAQFFVFAMFNTASVFDYMRIYDNNAASGTLLFSNYFGGTVDYGTNGTSPMFTVTATNATGCLTFGFWASSVVDRAGWDALITTIPTVLPVSIGYFAANQAGSQIALEWTTTQDVQDVSRFEVESSGDGIVFDRIADVDASQHSSQQPFRYSDVNPRDGANYYRILQVNRNGELFTSTVVSAHYEKTHSAFTLGAVSPGADGESYLAQYALDDNSSLQYQLLNAVGQTLQEGNLQGSTGRNELSLPLRSLDPGVYVLSMQTEKGDHQSVKFLVR
jgi:hypothetical protein